jgi:hypothetical protein
MGRGNGEPLMVSELGKKVAHAESSGPLVLSWAICLHLLRLPLFTSIHPTLHPRRFSTTVRNHV